MSPQWIEVDDEVMAIVKDQAEPFVDSPNDALRQLLGLKPVEGKDCARLPSVRPPSPRRRRAAAGDLLPMSEYELPLLRALSQLGGSAPRSKVREEVERLLADKLTELDRQPLESGEVRWSNRLGFARIRAIERGNLRSGSRRGIWELSDAGIERLGQLEVEAASREGGAPA